MHILLLNEYYPPDTSATARIAALFAESLAQQHRVTVLCGRPSYDPSERHPYYLWRREVRGNITVERVGSTAFPRFRMRRRVSNYLTYLLLAVPRALTISADVILTMTDPPVAGMAGALVSKWRGRPFVYDIQDLYPDMALGAEIIRESRWAERWEKWHRRTLRRARRVIVLSEDMRERIVAKGVDPARVVIVRNGAELPRETAPPEDPLSQEIRCGFPFAVVYAGNLGFYGAWKTLVRAAQLLESDGVGFIFMGEGALRKQIEDSAQGCKTVRFLPTRPAADMPYVLAGGDLHIVTVRRGLEGVVVPSKLYPILAAGRPVLAVAPETCDAARIVRQFGCGVVADPDDPAAVAQAVRQLRQSPGELTRMAQRARDAAKNYARVNELSRFVRVVEEAGRSQ